MCVLLEGDFTYNARKLKRILLVYIWGKHAGAEGMRGRVGEGGRETMEEDMQHNPDAQVFSHDMIPWMKKTIAFLAINYSCKYVCVIGG